MPLIAGCDATSSDSSSAPTSSSSGSGPSVQRDELPRNDLTSEWVAPWSRFEQNATDQLRFFYTGGDPACYGVRVAVYETTTTITVATIVGIKPNAPNECILIASLSSVLVTTSQPVGTRAVTHLENPPLHA